MYRSLDGILKANFSAIPKLTKGLAKIKNGEPINIDQFSALVTPTGNSSNFLEDLIRLNV